jgi:NAD(P)-dependent dehydrogenase (short-subunit alcohol dehydrogenase family)
MHAAPPSSLVAIMSFQSHSDTTFRSSLAGRRVLVMGADAGSSGALIAALSAVGASLLVQYAPGPRAPDRVLRQAQRAGLGLRVFPTDLATADRGALGRFVATAARAFNGIDALISFCPSPVPTEPAEAMDAAVHRLDLPCRLAQHAARAMAEPDRHGHVILVQAHAPEAASGTPVTAVKRRSHQRPPADQALGHMVLAAVVEGLSREFTDTGVTCLGVQADGMDPDATSLTLLSLLDTSVDLRGQVITPDSGAAAAAMRARLASQSPTLHRQPSRLR